MKKSLILGVMAASAALVACGSDSSTDANNQAPQSSTSVNQSAAGSSDKSYESLDDLPSCTKNRQFKMFKVGLGVNAENYICAKVDGEYDYQKLIDVVEFNEEDELPVCNTKKKGKFVFATEDEVLLQCNGEQWKTVSDKSSAPSDEPSGDKSSSSGKPSAGDDVPVVDLQPGIIWQPSYGERAYTFEEGITKENFAADENGSGYWYSYNDKSNGGTSTISLVIGKEYIAADFLLKYNNWHKTTNGIDIYYAPDPYPYATIGFDLVSNTGTTKNSIDIRERFGSGICITYTSENRHTLNVESNASSANYSFTLLPASVKTTKNISWALFEQPDWAYDQLLDVPQSTAFAKATAIQIQYNNDIAGVSCPIEIYPNCYRSKSSSIKIYKLGTYGSCD